MHYPLTSIDRVWNVMVYAVKIDRSLKVKPKRKSVLNTIVCNTFYVRA